jgi:ankyrin repeat protein
MSLALAQDPLTAKTTFDADANKFRQAARNGNLIELERLYHCHDRAIVNAKDKEGGWTALHLVACNGRMPVIQYLVETCDANVNAVDDFGCTPLHGASWYGIFRVVQYLVETCGANIHVMDKKGQTGLLMACIFDYHLPVVQMLARAGASVHVVDVDGWIPLSKAVSNGVKKNEMQIVQYLAEQCGVDILAVKDIGIPPLYLACCTRFARAVLYFVSLLPAVV